MTPGQLVAHFRENQNNNKTLKSLFASQFLRNFSAEALEGALGVADFASALEGATDVSSP